MAGLFFDGNWHSGAFEVEENLRDFRSRPNTFFSGAWSENVYNCEVAGCSPNKSNTCNNANIDGGPLHACLVHPRIKSRDKGSGTI